MAGWSWKPMVRSCQSFQLVIPFDTLHVHAGVLELIDFIRKENIKTLMEHIMEHHIGR